MTRKSAHSQARKAATAHRRSLTAFAAAAFAFVVLQSGVAYADTSSASGTAASVTLVNGTTVTTGTASATNDGTQSTVTATQTPALSVLGGQTLITAGTLTQQARAANDGSSAACAGIVGAGGSVVIAPDGSCTVTQGAGDVQISLGGGVVIKAKAIIAQCTASSTGTPTASAIIANGTINTTVLGVTTTVPFASSPAVNSGVNVPGVATLGTNMQTTGTGTITATALQISLLSTAVSANIASATCGPNAHVLPTPAFPVHGLPLAAALLLATLGLWYRSRRRAALRAQAAS